MSRLDKLPDNPYNAFSWFVTPEGITIGSDCWIGPFTTIDGTGGLKIGKGVTIGMCSQIMSHSGVNRCISEKIYPHIDKARTVIEDHCFIGVNATILMGSYIGHHSVVGAGTVITEFSKFEPFSLIIGNPGKVVRKVEALGQLPTDLSVGFLKKYS